MIRIFLSLFLISFLQSQDDLEGALPLAVEKTCKVLEAFVKPFINSKVSNAINFCGLNLSGSPHQKSWMRQPKTD